MATLCLLMKTKALVIRLTPKQEEFILARAQEKGFSYRSEYVRSILFEEEGINPMIPEMDDGFAMLRGERRSFFCPNTLWKKIVEKTGDCVSISQFIRKAIEEKMEKED